MMFARDISKHEKETLKIKQWKKNSMQIAMEIKLV